MFAQGQGDVMTAETEGIAQRKPDVDGFASVSHVVEVTLRILIFDIDGRMNKSVTQRKAPSPPLRLLRPRPACVRSSTYSN